MTPEQAKFIIETLETAIDWAEYATPYFQEKHNLPKDKEDVLKAIALLKELKSETCGNCKYGYGFSGTLMLCDSHRGFVPNRVCDRWEQK